METDLTSGFMHLGDGISVRLPEGEGKRFGMVGKSGSGKTNAMLVMARQLIEAGWVIAFIDPMNAFRRLRAAGLPVVVAGARESADVRLTPANAEKLAAISFDEGVSMALDCQTRLAGSAAHRLGHPDGWRRHSEHCRCLSAEQLPSAGREDAAAAVK